jgi:hypothetical protein
MRRSDALSIIAAVVPSRWGDPAFEAITGGAYSPGYGTTCGYLCSYLLHQLGCRDPRIINRRDDDAGLEYHPGENISRLVYGAHALGAWRDGPLRIKPGDIYFISRGPASSEHVGVFLRAAPGLWHTADAGQTDAYGDQAAVYLARPFDGASLGHPNGGEPRPVVGYVDLNAIPLPFPWRGLLLPGALAAAVFLTR